jgi:uncharacterized protein YutE (UPF0331/DUF86 family)
MNESNIVDYCNAELENIEKVVKELAALLSNKQADFSIIELSAIATFLHNFYNGVENVLKRILKNKELPFSQSETWHKDVLNMARDNEIIEQILYDRLYDYLTFRHMFVHSYFYSN